jgi:hypothetical protein
MPFARYLDALPQTWSGAASAVFDAKNLSLPIAFQLKAARKAAAKDYSL